MGPVFLKKLLDILVLYPKKWFSFPLNGFSSLAVKFCYLILPAGHCPIANPKVNTKSIKVSCFIFGIQNANVSGLKKASHKCYFMMKIYYCKNPKNTHVTLIDVCIFAKKRRPFR